MSEDWKQYEKEMNIFFSDLKKCNINECPKHKGECKYLGTVDERLEKYKKMRIENTITRKNKKFNT